MARCRLWDSMQSCLKAGHKVYYCDTDSIVTDAEIQSSKAIGELKAVCKIKRARFVAPKLYFLDKEDGELEVKAKGFSGGFGSGKLTEREFRLLVDYRQKIKIKRIIKLKEGLRNIEKFPSMQTEEKGLKHLDEKRIHLPDGNTIAKVIYESD